jgi:hypothetical protein
MPVIQELVKLKRGMSSIEGRMRTQGKQKA